MQESAQVKIITVQDVIANNSYKWQYFWKVFKNIAVFVGDISCNIRIFLDIYSNVIK